MSFLLKKVALLSSSPSSPELGLSDYPTNLSDDSKLPGNQHEHHSLTGPRLSLSDNTTPLIPEHLANIVSTLSRGSTITLRLGTYIMVSLLDSARIGTLTSLSVTCGAIESILLKAECDNQNQNQSSEFSNPSSPLSQSFHKSKHQPSTKLLDSTHQTDICFLDGSLSHSQNLTSAEMMTNSSINVVNRVATIAQLFTAASFHLASSSLQTASSIAQDALHVLDAVFGSTDSSRALAAIISLLRRELGDGSGIYSLVSSLTCFTLLQSRGWSRTVDEIEMFIIWDVVVLDTGETLSQQFPAIDDSERKKESDEDAIISAIPNNSQYRISIDEIKTKTFTISVVSQSSVLSVKLPEGAVVIHKEFIPPNNPNEESKYAITFQTTSKYYRERKGTVNKSCNHKLGHAIPAASECILDPTNVSIKTSSDSPEFPDNFDDEPPPSIDDQRFSFHNPIVIETLLKNQIDSGNSSDSENKSIKSEISFEENDSQCASCLSIPHAENEQPTKPECSLNESNNLIPNDFDSKEFEIKLKKPISPGHIDRESLHQLPGLARSASYPHQSTHSTSFDTQFDLTDAPNSVSSFVPLTYNAFKSRKRPNTINETLQNNKYSKTNFNTKSNINFNHSNNINSSVRPNQRHTFSNFNNAQQAPSFVPETPSITSTKFPAGHVTQNMAKYMRFATASYGQSFMSVLGVGKYYSPYGGYNGGNSHHSEHYAFAHHTRLSLNDILLSSYSDTAIDDKAGIPLVHFVAIDHQAKAVVLTIRGTLGIEDILTDLTCDYETMQWNNESWNTHGGMFRCAQILKRRTSRVLATIRQALETLGSDYGLIICGHSLGGGVGAILGILLSEIRSDGVFVTSNKLAQTYPFALPPNRRIHCFTYGPAASISEELRIKTRGLITSVVYGLDIVPCLSLGVLRDFQNVALAFKNDEEGIAVDIRKRLIAQFASRHIPLSVHDSDDDYLWELLTKLRAVMDSEKLVPPGEVYHISTNTVFETHDGKTKRATRIICKVIVNVEKRFAEPVFGRGIFHHSPLYYERATRTLEMGVCNAPV